MKIREILCEVKIIPTASSKDEREPLEDSDSILVYHGTNDLDTVISAVTHGLTGDKRANRTYSYEFNNNPKGLFVTPDFKTAKEFGVFIFEIHCKVSDLEAPVWPGGTFTVQGGYSQNFKDDEEREQSRMALRKEYSTEDTPDFIKQSDRPELAAILMASGERQALFIGDLNKNSVRAVWVSNEPDRAYSTYQRYNLPDFLKKMKKEGITGRYGITASDIEKDELRRELQDKAVQPRDDASADAVIDFVSKKNAIIPREEIISILKDNPDYVRRFVWSDRQFNDVIRQLRQL